eukprot:351236-Chlamydomonas_euryale.AAC.6
MQDTCCTGDDGLPPLLAAPPLRSVMSDIYSRADACAAPSDGPSRGIPQHAITTAAVARATKSCKQLKLALLVAGGDDADEPPYLQASLCGCPPAVVMVAVVQAVVAVAG